MFFILIVEDDPPTRKLLRNYLAQENLDAVIHTAANVEEANKTLTTADQKGIQYKVVILDFILPPKAGEQPEVDTTLRRRVLDSTSKNALVFHITAAPDDPKIVDFIRTHALNRRLARYDLIPKTGFWPERLQEEINKEIYPDLISERFERLFGQSFSGERLEMQSRGGNYFVSDSTQELADLMRDIMTHWSLLEENIKNRIRQVFRIRERKKKITVSLL